MSEKTYKCYRDLKKVHSGIVEHDGLDTDQRAVDTKGVWRQYFLGPKGR